MTSTFEPISARARFARATAIACALIVFAALAGRGANSAALPKPLQGCGLIGTCPEIEQPKEVISAIAHLAQRFGAATPGALGKATAQRAHIAAAVAPIPGGGNAWQPVGTTPLLADDSKYSVYGEGLGRLGGRIADFFWDASHHRILAAVASGGVWQSTNMGENWTSIGDGLETQQVSSVAYTPANGGTILAITGDNAFGGYTYAGTGAFWSADDGKTWNKAQGIPDGAMGFKIAVDPTDSKVIYVATGVGLYRSANAGRTFTNVDLPTGECHGNSFQTDCFLANIVTDVVVQAPDSFDHAGGAVLAVVGWRAGNLAYPDGKPQAPGNGLYYSDNGKPGTFQDLDEDANGFAKQANIGRVELGEATGPDQNHGYVYALVQDAKLFQSRKLENLDTGLDGDPLGLGVDPTASPTHLNGVYVSADFGKTWTLMADKHQFLNPASGSVLSLFVGLGLAPGFQSWYDEWIKPDPTRQVNGIPTRLELGLEEIYETRTTHTPLVGPADFRVTGPYFAAAPCLLVAAGPACGAARTLPTWSTTHPDQHAGIWIPDGAGGVTLVVGNDGGVYTQKLDALSEVTTQGFGSGANEGFHTLLPYGVDIANDGIIYAGLQDNGEMRIEPDGRQVMTYGGDGVFTVVNPKDSNIVWEETPGASIKVTTDGGVTWVSKTPSVDNASFYAPIVMDPKSADHIVSGGRQVVETISGPSTSGTSDAGATGARWFRVFDLGTRLHPGQPTQNDDVSGYPILEAGDIQNQVSSLGVQGAAVYAGFCGSCDPLLDKSLFHAGIATNVGGAAKPSSTTADGWHIAKALGLPQRFITSITVDPDDVKTVYVTLGTSTLRPYISAKGYKVYKVSDEGGMIFKSTDAGAHFFDISGNLPKIGGTWSLLRNGKLILGTTVGVFASTTDASTATASHPLEWSVLGKGLPAAPIFTMSLKKNDPNTLIVATLGRGVYRYVFSASGSTRPLTKVRGARHTLPSTGLPGADPIGWAVVALALAVVIRMRRHPANR